MLSLWVVELSGWVFSFVGIRVRVFGGRRESRDGEDMLGFERSESEVKEKWISS